MANCHKICVRIFCANLPCSLCGRYTKTAKMKLYHCWKCDKEMPFLEEHEWDKIEPYLESSMQEIKKYRAKNGCDIKTANDDCKTKASLTFQELTGIGKVSVSTIYHHRLADWGNECQNCGHLLRTKNATICARCGK